MAHTIDREELEQLIARGEAVVLEALPAAHFDQAHLPGALNLPLDELDDLAPRLVPDKGQAIVTYCSNTACSNSEIAAQRLRSLGYRNVRTFPGGKQDWMESGLPVEAGVHP